MAKPRSDAAWEALSSGQRARYIQRLGGGDSATARDRYVSGESLGAARGHREAAEHRSRVARGVARGLTPGEAAGRGGAGGIERSFAGVPVREPGGGTRVVEVAMRDAGAASRLGRYEHDVGDLVAGRLSDAEFRDRWRGRRVAGHRVEDRPDRVLEALRREGPPPDGVRYRRVSPVGVTP